MTRFDELRAKHPRFTYEDYAVERTRDDLRFTFSHLAFAETQQQAIQQNIFAAS